MAVAAVVAAVVVAAVVALEVVDLVAALVAAPAVALLLVPRPEGRQELALGHLAHTAVDTMAAAQPCLTLLVRGHPRDLSRPLF